MIKDIMKLSGKDYRMAREKVHVFHPLRLFCSALMLGQALARDGFRCIITVTCLIDETSLRGNAAELQRENEITGGVVNEVCTVVEPSITVHSLHPLPRHIMLLVF